MRQIMLGVLTLVIVCGFSAGQPNTPNTPASAPATAPTSTIGPAPKTSPKTPPGPVATIGPANPTTPAAVDPKQAAIKSDMMLRISQFIYGYKDKQMFYKWMSFGDTAKFRQRLNDPAVTISVDSGLKSMAEYRTGSQTIVLRHDPQKFIYSLDSSGDSSLLLWHETIHAISHGHQLGSIKPSHPFKSAPKNIAPDAKGNIKSIDKAEGLIDHYYINWAESCIGATKYLVRLEKILKENGKTIPPDDVKTLAQKNWNGFVKNCNFSIYGQVPDEKEKKELEQMIGFRCDPNEVLNGYLSLGYPLEYFGNYATDEQIWKLFPTSEQVGAVGLPVKKDKSALGKLSANYVKSWNQEPSGRQFAIHLTFYGSEEISKVVWDAITKAQKGNFTAVPNVGDAAFLQDRGENNGYFATARYGNVHVLMTDIVVTKPEKGPFQVTRRPINWNYVRWVFKNMDALSIPPIPAGVETSIEKLKAGG